MTNTMYCARCKKTLALALFFDAAHGRYLAYCLPCRRGTVVDVDVRAAKEPKVVSLSQRLPRAAIPTRSGLRLVEDARVAQSIRFVMAQL